MNIDKKLQVLVEIAHVLNENKVRWAVGGSLLLYFKGISDSFHDIDLMVVEEDIDQVKELFSTLGELLPIHDDQHFKTRYFLEYTIKGIDVDVMAGFVIVKDGMDYDCSLLPEQIIEYLPFENEVIPLQSVWDWRRYYELMGREAKVQMIDEKR